jgi:hypothetical protein
MMRTTQNKKKTTAMAILWARFHIEVVDDERCPLIEG